MSHLVYYGCLVSPEFITTDSNQALFTANSVIPQKIFLVVVLFYKSARKQELFGRFPVKNSGLIRFGTDNTFNSLKDNVFYFGKLISASPFFVVTVYM